MLTLRKSEDRGFVDHGWLKARHTFSFSSYYDPQNMGFRDLRVINQDIVAPSSGFSTHPHKDMEIITYVLRGAVEHRDSMGNHYTIHNGEIQAMSAGTGVTHSEHNPSAKENLELLQIWILPNATGHAPNYQSRRIERSVENRKLRLMVSPTGGADVAKIHQDTYLYSSLLDKSENVDFQIKPQRYVWIQMIAGRLQVNDLVLNPGDGLAVSQETRLNLTALANSEFLLFDLK